MTTLTLGELTKNTRPICYGVLKPGAEVFGGVPLIKIQDIKGNRLSFDKVQRISDSLSQEFGRSILSGGEVLLSIQGTIGRVAIVPEWAAGSNISRTIAVIEPDSRCLPQYLAYFLMYLAAINGFKVTGTTRDSLNISEIRETSVPIGSIEDQKRIVETLDDQLSRLDKSLSDLDHADSQALALKRSILNELLNPQVVGSEQEIERMMESPNRWVLKKLGDVAKLEKGSTITAKTSRPGNVPVVAGGKQPAYFHDAANRPKNTITVSASGAYAGFVAFYKEPIFASDCTTVNVQEDSECSIEYLYYFMLSRQNHIYSFQRGSGMPHVYAKDLALLDVPVPPLEEQKRIVETLDDQLSRLASTRKSIANQKSLLAGLRNSLLNSAFTGQLIKEI
jgi:type I restriction enzyme, S subunit